MADLAKGPKQVHSLATKQGWSIQQQDVDGPPQTVALKMHRGEHRCYALWALDDESVKFLRAGARRVPPGPLRTVTALKAYLTDPDAVPEVSDADSDLAPTG